MLKTSIKRTSWICVLACCACTTQGPIARMPMANMQQVLPPPPTAVMVPRTANFQERLVNFFSVSPQKQTQ